MNNNNKYSSTLIFSIIASLTLGLAPFFPEPHIVGKIRWIAGGAHGMKAIDYLDFLMHGLPWILLIYTLIRIIINQMNRSNNLDIHRIVIDPNVNIIDVREPIEFERKSLIEAINMPLSRFDSYIEEIRQMKGPIVLFCQSGSRSAQAMAMLKAKGIEDVYNGGGLKQMKRYLASTQSQ